jgi:hypothetical protein
MGSGAGKSDVSRLRWHLLTSAPLFQVVASLASSLTNLDQCLDILEAMLQNPSLFSEPYVSAICEMPIRNGAELEVPFSSTKFSLVSFPSFSLPLSARPQRKVKHPFLHTSAHGSTQLLSFHSSLRGTATPIQRSSLEQCRLYYAVW